jgi:hypothetical protein
MVFPHTKVFWTGFGQQLTAIADWHWSPDDGPSSGTQDREKTAGKFSPAFCLPADALRHREKA